MRRPWRLTRRQRVEMEAALMDLRGCIQIADDGLGMAEDTMRALRAVCGHVSIDEQRALAAVPEPVLRARVAIALRAALRADEDARCEEAYRRAGPGAAACEAIDALREWPRADPWVVVRTVPCVVRAQRERVPLALWEVER